MKQTISRRWNTSWHSLFFQYEAGAKTSAAALLFGLEPWPALLPLWLERNWNTIQNSWMCYLLVLKLSTPARRFYNWQTFKQYYNGPVTPAIYSTQLLRLRGWICGNHFLAYVIALVGTHCDVWMCSIKCSTIQYSMISPCNRKCAIDPNKGCIHADWKGQRIATNK